MYRNYNYRMISTKHADLPCFFWVTPILTDDHHYRKPLYGLVVLLSDCRRFHDSASGDQRPYDDCCTLEQQVEPATDVSEAWRCLLVNRAAFYVHCRRLMHNLDALAALVHRPLSSALIYGDVMLSWLHSQKACVYTFPACPVAKSTAHCHCQYFDVLNITWR